MGRASRLIVTNPRPSPRACTSAPGYTVEVSHRRSRVVAILCFACVCPSTADRRSPESSALPKPDWRPAAHAPVRTAPRYP